MVSLIKNQILKHLSKFTKNLSTDKFNFSTLKGEGELTDLELDETVLSDLLELPSWLRLTSAKCNRVSFRIPWAKLKTTPMHLMLDEVHVEVETCEEPRSTSSSQGLSSYAGAAKYNWIHKVIDGITVTVNTVLVTFRSPAFTSSVELSRILVESKSPEWRKVDLPGTRVKDPSKEYVLLFKELTWNNVRIEAKSTRDRNLTPLRLITNSATCKIILKKRIRDSFIMGSRLIVTLEDLLWVLTDYQLKAALHFLDSLAGLIQKSTELTRKRKAARKLEFCPEYQAQQSQQARAQENNQQGDTGTNATSTKTASQRFAKIDVVETSYHFIAHKIDLQICDDNSEGRSCHPELENGGSLLVTLKCFQVDLYPYHLATGDRRHWPMYPESNSYHTKWLKTGHDKFTAQVLASAQTHCSCPASQAGTPSSPANLTPQQIRTFVIRQLSMLMTSCFIMRLADFTIYQVTTSKKHVSKELIAGDKERYHLPANCPILQAEFTYYYYPSDDLFPLPTPKLCLHLEPIQATFDVVSMLWLNAFALDLQQSLLMTAAAGNDAMVTSIMSFDVNVVAINTRVVFEATEDHTGQRDRPRSLQMQVSRTSITNVRYTDAGFRTDLEASVTAFHLGSLFHHSDFPTEAHDLRLQIDAFSRLCAAPGKSMMEPSTVSTFEDVRSVLNSFPTPGRKEVWHVSLDSLSGSFYGARAVGKDQAVAFLDNLPVTLWKASDLTVVVGAVVPQVDVTLLMPSQTPGKSSSGGDMESFIPDSSSLQDDNWQSSSSVVNEKGKSSREQIRVSDTTLNEKTANGEVKHQFTLRKDPPFKINNEPEVREQRRLSVGHISLSEETSTTIWELRRAFKKGVGNIMASLDIAGNQSPDDMSSTISLRSDPSTDSDCVIVPDIGDVDPLESLYCAIANVEEAAECIEDDVTVTSPSERDSFTNSIKRHDLVSICTLKLRKMEALVELRGPSSIVKVEVNNIAVGECPSIPWDEFQSKFNSRHRGWTEQGSIDTGPRQIALRMKKEAGGAESGFASIADINARVRAIRLTLSVSSIAGIVDLVEDELRPAPIPATVLLEDIRFHIVDDRPASHITSIEPSPVDIVIHHLLVRRDASGVIEIPMTGASQEQIKRSEKEDAALKRLQAENEDLRRRLAALERLTDENYRLKLYQEETESLRPYLNDAQNKVEALIEDKRVLLDNVRSLQHQLNQSDRNAKR